MTLDEFRKQNPAYADKDQWSDEDLANGLYNKYYKQDMTREEFDKKIFSSPASAPTTASPEPAEGWKAAAEKMTRRVAASEGAGIDGAPWIDPTAAVVGPGAAGAKLGLGLAKTAAMVTSSLLAEPIVGTGMELVDEKMTEKGTPWQIQVPVDIALSVATGSLTEAGISKLGGQVVKALKGAPATVESVGRVLQNLKVAETGSEQVIRDVIQTPAKPRDMKAIVKALTENNTKGDLPEIPVSAVSEAVGPTVSTAPDVVSPRVASTSDRLTGMALGAGAGVSQNEDGSIELDPKMTLLGIALGGVGATAANKIFTGTRMPGIKGGAKAEVKTLRAEARAMQEAGASAYEIYKKTGLFQGSDLRWRQELDDSEAQFDFSAFQRGEKTAPLGQIIENHPELYRRYPQLKDMPVTAVKSDSSYGTFYRGSDPVTAPGHIELNSSLDADRTKRTLMHELQHGVQYIEGHDTGGSARGMISLNSTLISSRDMLKSELKTADPEMTDLINERLKALDKKIKYLGLEPYSNKITELGKEMSDLSNEQSVVLLKLKDARELGESTTELKALRDEINTRIMDTDKRMREANAAYEKAAFEKYESIAGEQEARLTSSRLNMSATERAADPERVTSDALRMIKFESSVMATGGVLGGAYEGVDWDTLESTGEIRIDPNKAFRGALLGVAAGAGIKAAPKAAEHWTDFTKSRILTPLADAVNGSIVNETLRYQFGLNRSPELAAMLTEYKTQANTVIQKAVDIGKEINAIAPTGLQQRRLTQLLEGGVTTNPSLARKVSEIHAMFEDLSSATKAMNLSRYSQFDELTRKQRAELRNIIKSTDTPEAERITAQTMLNNHYHVGSAKAYLPVFNPGVEGLTRSEQKILRQEIADLKRKSRYGDPEGKPALETQIAELENMLLKGQRKPEFWKKTPKGVERTAGTTMNLGYTMQRQDLPYETRKVFNDIIGPAYRVAKGAKVQGTDVLKAKLFEHIAAHPDWIQEAGTPNKANFIKVLGSEWGALNGKRIRNDVLDDLGEIMDLRSAAEANMDKIMGYWKYGKAILSPVTHARNFVSNMVLAHFADVPPADLVTYNSAAKALKEKSANTFYREAERAGLYNSSFAKSEIGALRDELNEIRRPDAFANWIRKAASLPSAMYEGSERFFKTAVFIKARESGLSPVEAMQKAEKHLFNYSDIPPVIKHYKRWAAPFATYTYKAVPLLAETAITKPWKIAGVFGAMYGLEYMAQQKLGVSDDEVSKDKAVMLKGTGQVLLPFTDSYGNRLYGNVGDFMPWSNMGKSWGQSSIPAGDMLPSNPIFTTLGAILANKDAFTGKEIHSIALDSASKITGRYLEYAWKQIQPSAIPAGAKLWEAGKISMGQQLKDYTGYDIDPSTLAINALLGVKLTKGNQELFNRFASYELKKLQKAVGERKSEIYRQLRANQITAEEADQKLQELRTAQEEQRPRW
jgi:hypothetical protein